MSAGTDKFAPPSAGEIARLLHGFPLAWLVTAANGEFQATALPFRPRFDAAGRVTELVGHIPRHNPQTAILRANPRAFVLFTGPQGYISPSWMADRTQAPTWNYASAQFTVDVQFTEGDAELDPLMNELVDAMEAGRPRAWGTTDMGPRYRKLADRVIGFHAVVRSARVKFKLGQDERDDVYADILKGLAATGATELVDWMRRANPGRDSG